MSVNLALQRQSQHVARLTHGKIFKVALADRQSAALTSRFHGSWPAKSASPSARWPHKRRGCGENTYHRRRCISPQCDWRRTERPSPVCCQYLADRFGGLGAKSSCQHTNHRRASFVGSARAADHISLPSGLTSQTSCSDLDAWIPRSQAVQGLTFGVLRRQPGLIQRMPHRNMQKALSRATNNALRRSLHNFDAGY
jgi:hypothetical protein